MGNVQMEADQIRYKDSSGTYRNVQTGLAAAIAGGGGGSSTLAGLTDTDITTPTNGQVLAYDSTESKWVNAASASGATTLEGLTDTAISTPEDGQVLTYDSTAEKWENAAIPAQSIDGLSDTTITTPSDGQVLTYDATAEKWVNASGGSGGGGEVYPAVGTEAKIGTWGTSDLYRRVYTHTISGTSPNVIDLGIPDTYTVRRISGTHVRSGATYATPYYYSNSNFIVLYVSSDSGNLKANVAFTGSFTGDSTIFVDYTKPVTP